MNTLKNILVIVLVVTLFTACKNEVKPEVETITIETNTKKELDPNATYAKTEFTIDGMTCAIGCAKTIEKKIANMDGVKSATVDFDKRLAMVEYDEAKVNHTSLEETVSKVADIYKVSDMKTVDDFSNTKECTAKCSADCTKKDCADCAAKKAECKKKCDAKKECNTKCSPDCTKVDCADCAAKKAECKKKCDAKKAEANDGDKKMACAEDCKKACCAGKKSKA